MNRKANWYFYRSSKKFICILAQSVSMLAESRHGGSNVIEQNISLNWLQHLANTANCFSFNAPCTQIIYTCCVTYWQIWIRTWTLLGHCSPCICSSVTSDLFCFPAHHLVCPLPVITWRSLVCSVVSSSTNFTYIIVLIRYSVSATCKLWFYCSVLILRFPPCDCDSGQFK